MHPLRRSKATAYQSVPMHFVPREGSALVSHELRRRGGRLPRAIAPQTTVRHQQIFLMGAKLWVIRKKPRATGTRLISRTGSMNTSSARSVANAHPSRAEARSGYTQAVLTCSAPQKYLWKPSEPSGSTYEMHSRKRSATSETHARQNFQWSSLAVIARRWTTAYA